MPRRARSSDVAPWIRPAGARSPTSAPVCGRAQRCGAVTGMPRGAKNIFFPLAAYNPGARPSESELAQAADTPAGHVCKHTIRLLWELINTWALIGEVLFVTYYTT